MSKTDLQLHAVRYLIFAVCRVRFSEILSFSFGVKFYGTAIVKAAVGSNKFFYIGAAYKI